MESPTIDALARRLERLERENRRWKWLAGLSALGLALALTPGGLVGPRAVVAQQPRQKAANPAPPAIEYRVVDVGLSGGLIPIERSLQRLGGEGWELVQVVPTNRDYLFGVMVLRRPPAGR